MRTRITEAFGIRHPIILSGMSWISLPQMVAAVSNAGGLGILATGVYNPEQTRQAIREVRALTDKPFGANATLYFPGAKENAQVLLDEKVPVINFSMGKGDWIVKGAHEYGGKVVASVVNEKHARSAAEYGTDALIVTANEAAAHAGECGGMVLIPAIVDAVKIPVIAAGGIADGRGLAAALALGADGVAMGTRLMCTRESPAHERCKQLAIEKTFEDTLYSTRFDGQWCRVMRGPGAERARKKGLDLPAAALNGREIAKMMDLSYVKLAVGVMASGWRNVKQLAFLANAFKAFRLAIEEGDERRGMLPLGQSTGLVHDTPTVAEVLERTVAEAKAIQARVAKAVA